MPFTNNLICFIGVYDNYDITFQLAFLFSSARLLFVCNESAMSLFCLRGFRKSQLGLLHGRLALDIVLFQPFGELERSFFIFIVR